MALLAIMSNRYKYWVSHGDPEFKFSKSKVWDHKKGLVCECNDHKDALMIKEALYLLHDKKRGKS